MSLPLRRCRIYLWESFRFNMWKSSRAYKRLIASCYFRLAGKTGKSIERYIGRTERGCRVGKRMNERHTGEKNTSIVLTLLIMVITETGYVIAATAKAPSRQFLCGGGKKKIKNRQYAHHRSRLTNLRRIRSSLPDRFPSRSVSPISATCSPGNNRFTGRIRAELAVHASANCY